MAESSFFRAVSRPFITGIFALLPLALAVAIISWLVGYLARFLGPGSTIGGALKKVGWDFGTSEWGAYAGGLLFTLLLIYILGLLVEYVFKDRWSGLIDRFTSRVPIFSTVYEASKRIVRMLEPRDSPEMQSMTPVMCNFGAENGTSIPAFMPTNEVFEINGREYHVVMVPTAPVPFGGAIMCVPRESVTPLDSGIDGLFNIYMSMGTVLPSYMASRENDATREREG